MSSSAVIFGCEGAALSAPERAFFAEAQPWGFILFARNVETPAQVSALVAELRESVGWNAPVLIDQEGGRVARLRPPHWHGWPAALSTAEHPDLTEEQRCEALRLRYRLIGSELAALGIDVNCAPLLDVPQPSAHDVIGDRALGASPAPIIRRARAVYDGLLDAGILPVIKHLPGHGRALLDTHFALPVVDTPLSELQKVDFAPFAAFSDAPLAMTAHVVYSAVDGENCATMSRRVLDMAREEMGIAGAIMTDDLSMKALSGDFQARTRDALAAGCDLALHCNGDLSEMQAVASEAPTLTGKPLARCEQALAMRGQPEDAAAVADAAARYGALLGPIERGPAHA